MAYHSSILPLFDWYVLLCHCRDRFWVLVEVVLHLVTTEVAIFVVLLKVVFVLLVV